MSGRETQYQCLRIYQFPVLSVREIKKEIENQDLLQWLASIQEICTGVILKHLTTPVKDHVSRYRACLECVGILYRYCHADPACIHYIGTSVYSIMGTNLSRWVGVSAICSSAWFFILFAAVLGNKKKLIKVGRPT